MTTPRSSVYTILTLTLSGMIEVVLKFFKSYTNKSTIIIDANSVALYGNTARI